MLKICAGIFETYVHECPEGKGQPAVYFHEDYAYMIFDGIPRVIRYCPYCGTFIEDDNEAA